MHIFTKVFPFPTSAKSKGNTHESRWCVTEFLVCHSVARNLKSLLKLWKLGLFLFPYWLLPYFLIFHCTEQLLWSHNMHRHHTPTHTHTHRGGESRMTLHYLFSNFISVFSCVSAALRILLSLNNLWGACVFLQPETVISALLPHAPAHLSLCSLSSPECLSPLVFSPLCLSQVVSGTSCNRTRLSWSFSLTPGSMANVTF